LLGLKINKSPIQLNGQIQAQTIFEGRSIMIAQNMPGHIRNLSGMKKMKFNKSLIASGKKK
jgi:hypothetical protein